MEMPGTLTITTIVEGTLLGVLSAFILVLVNVLASLTSRLGVSSMDEEEFTSHIAQEVNDWIEEKRREYNDPEWYPRNGIHDILEVAEEKFYHGKF